MQYRTHLGAARQAYTRLERDPVVQAFSDLVNLRPIDYTRTPKQAVLNGLKGGGTRKAMALLKRWDKENNNARD
jgi:hypothetical protein